MPSLLYQLHFNNFKVAISVISFIDFSGPAALPEYLHIENFTKSCFGHPL